MTTLSIIRVMQDVFDKPPIPYEPAKHSLKAWAKYCLQDRGFKVVYAERGDFAVETRTREKLYFKVSDRPIEREPTIGGIVWDTTTQSATVIAPQV